MSSGSLTLLMALVTHLYSAPTRNWRLDCDRLELVTYVRTRLPTFRSNLPQRECPRSGDSQTTNWTTKQPLLW